MFKQAYVRGVQTALLQDGRVAFPDQETAIKVADFVAERVEFEPQEKVARETVIKVAESLIEASRYLHEQPGFKAASFQKLASVDDVNALAHAHVLHLMEKAAENTTYTTGGDLDGERKNEDYARLNPGEQSAIQSLITDKAVVGREVDIRDSVPIPASGSNSLYEHTEKASSLADLMKKVAENDKATKTDTELERKRQSDSYGMLSSQGGESALGKIDPKAIVGWETEPTDPPPNHPPGENSATKWTDKASSADPYVELFKKTAQEIVQYLPGALHEEAKIAHVRACMGMTSEEKAHYLHGLQKEAADKTASAQAAPYAHYNGKNANQKKVAEMPAFIQEKIDAKKERDGDGDGEKGEGDKKENPFATKSDKDGDGRTNDGEKDERKKESSLAEHFRRITGALNA